MALSECLNRFTTPENLLGGQWYCSQCKEHRDALKKLDIWRLGPISVFHLKRFHFDGRAHHKVQTLVDYPLRFTTDELGLGGNTEYQLFAVLVGVA